MSQSITSSYVVDHAHSKCNCRIPVVENASTFDSLRRESGEKRVEGKEFRVPSNIAKEHYRAPLQRYFLIEETIIIHRLIDHEI
jgi:hypothetical protein